MTGPLAKALQEWHQLGEWDSRVVHVSDLAVALPMPDGKCPRQLWLRLRGAEARPPTPGQTLMFSQGHALQRQVCDMIRPYLHLAQDDWEYAVNLRGITGRADWVLWWAGDSATVVDVKTLRGRAFQFQELPKPAHVLQVQAYIEGLAEGVAEDVKIDGRLLYVDREGQNAFVDYEVERDPAAVSSAIEVAMMVAESETKPPRLQPVVSVRRNKGPDAVYVAMPWQCDYCPYLDVACDAALPRSQRQLGIVGYKQEDGTFTAKKGLESWTEFVERGQVI